MTVIALLLVACFAFAAGPFLLGRLAGWATERLLRR